MSYILLTAIVLPVFINLALVSYHAYTNERLVKDDAVYGGWIGCKRLTYEVSRFPRKMSYRFS
jgi:hypothetical protein